jgi:hypothetical protein
MINTLRRIGIVVVLLAVAGSSPALDWTQLERLQKTPVAFGLKADGSYTFNTKDVDYGVSAELLFPVLGPARLRAQVLSLTILSGNHSMLAFNNDLAFDALVAYPLRRYLVYPYAYAGAGIVAHDNASSYVLRGGLGLEGKVQKVSRAFAEVGVAHTYSGIRTTQLRVSVGARFGR